MSFQFRPASRENVGLLIGIAGESGSGKTYSAMRLATGIARTLGRKTFCVIDTEAGRAKHYADNFSFDHGELNAPFSPDRYTEALMAADAAGYPVIVCDSFSHSWAGDGGVLDMQEAEFQRLGAREAVKLASWIKPKMQHKRMMTKLLQLRAHVILCFRADPKVDMVKGADGKMQIVPKQTLTGLDGFVPICEKTVPYELTASFLMRASKPGVPLPIKLQENHRAIFPEGAQIDEFAGERMAKWAAGGSAPRAGLESLDATVAAFAALGVGRAELEKYVGHELAEDDVPRLQRKLYAQQAKVSASTTAPTGF